VKDIAATATPDHVAVVDAVRLIADQLGIRQPEAASLLIVSGIPALSVDGRVRLARGDVTAYAQHLAQQAACRPSVRGAPTSATPPTTTTATRSRTTVTDHEVDTTITRLQPGPLVDITIKGVRIVQERPDGTVVINCEDDRARGVWPMPPQAAIKRAGQTDLIDAVTLQERISNALKAIDNMVDEQTLDPWAACWLRKQLDPNPRHWPPQVGDVWDDGMPFDGSLWFARTFQADIAGRTETAITMTNVEADRLTRTPDELLKSSDTLKLVYRHKDGAQ
jgi:hypothetical protein